VVDTTVCQAGKGLASSSCEEDMVPPVPLSGESWWDRPWTRVREAWRYVKLRLGLENQSIPAWYCAYVGVPQWYLRQSIRSKRMDQKRCQLAMFLRISAVLDLGAGLPYGIRGLHLRSSSRLLPFWRRCKRRFPVYAGGTFPIMGGGSVNTTLALRPGFDLVGSLVRVSRKLVHLCHLSKEWRVPFKGL